RGMVSKQTLAFLHTSGRHYLVGLRRSVVARFARQLQTRSGWQRLSEHEDVDIKLVRRGRKQYVLARSRPRRQKERAIRRRQRRGFGQGLAQAAGAAGQGEAEEPRQNLAAGRAVAGALSQSTSVRAHRRDEREKARLAMDLAGEGIPRGLGGGWRLCAAEQSQRLDGAGAVGNVYAIGGGRESLPRAQERTGAATGVASIQWPWPSPCVRLCLGLSPLENTGPTGQAGGLADADPQTGRGALRPAYSQTATDDAGSHFAGAGPDCDGRHSIADHGRPSAVVAAGRTTRPRAEAHPGRLADGA